MSKRLYFLLAFLAACASTGLENIPLLWKPTTGMFSMGSAELAELQNARLLLDPVTDGRENAALIGQNREEPTLRQVTTLDDVPAFVTTRMKALMSAAGIGVVDSDGTAVLTDPHDRRPDSNLMAIFGGGSHAGFHLVETVENLVETGLGQTQGD